MTATNPTRAILVFAMAALTMSCQQRNIPATAASTASVAGTTWTAPDGTEHVVKESFDSLERCDSDEEDSPLCRCDSHAQCNKRPNGKCVQDSQSYGRDPGVAQLCEYGCGSDTDCKPEQICVPPGADYGTATCVTATCSSNADCASANGKGQCAKLKRGSEYDGVLEYHCVPTGNECGGALDCADYAQQDAIENEEPTPDQFVCRFNRRKAECVRDPGPPE